MKIEVRKGMIGALACSVLLSGCAGMDISLPKILKAPAPTTSAPTVDAKGIQLELFEASRELTNRVLNGELNRLQAVDELNLLRLDLVGENNIDHEVFTLYRELTKNVHFGKMKQADLRQVLQHRLDSIRASGRVNHQAMPPIFTNFLLETIYQQPPL